MSAYQRSTDQTPVEDLLGEIRLTRAEQAALGDLLTSVTAPAHAGELRGEATALAAFRSALPAATITAPMSVAPRLSIKAAIAALTVVGMGGVAVAATTGSLPGPIDSPWNKPAQVKPELPVEPPLPVTPGPQAGLTVTPPAGQQGADAPGRTVSQNTRGAEKRNQVQERNAQRQQEQRDELAAERDARKARQAERRAQQAEKRQQLKDRQSAEQARPATGGGTAEDAGGLALELPTVPQSDRAVGNADR
jgi:hypothetical protein